MVTVTDFDTMATDDRWLGFGYLGERARTSVDTIEADARAVGAANAAGMDYDALFEWANSHAGRWYGDCMFGSNGSHAEKYLPGAPEIPVSRRHRHYAY